MADRVVSDKSKRHLRTECVSRSCLSDPGRPERSSSVSSTGQGSSEDTRGVRGSPSAGGLAVVISKTANTTHHPEGPETNRVVTTTGRKEERSITAHDDG